MGFINGETFLALLANYRILWVKGGFGGGKSALAYKVAYELVKSGQFKYIVSNIKDIWSDPVESIEWSENDTLDAVIILDEGGLFLRFGRDVEEYLTLLRKLNIVVLIPSVLPPSTRVTFFSCQRVMNLKRVGLPVWVMKWTLRYGEVNQETFFWTEPSEIFGVYDTKAPPNDDAGVSDWLIAKKEEFAKRAGYARSGSRRAAVIEGSGMDAGSGSASAVVEAAERIEGALSLYSEGFTKRRR